MKFSELEKARVDYNKRRKEIAETIFIIGLGLFIVETLSSISSSKDLYGIVGFGMFLGVLGIILYFIIAAIVPQKEYLAYKNAYKNYFITATFEKVFTELHYAHDAEMPISVIKNVNMIQMGNEYYSNDYTIAKYKGIPFTQADVHIESSHTDSDGDTVTTVIFCGRYITFDFNKKFEKKLIVASKYFGAEQVDKSFKKIELESTEFNRNFSVYAQDGFEAFYLLDPAVMERIEKLSNLHKNSILVGFADGKIHIAINDNTDSFEPASPSSPIDEAKEFEKVMNDIKVITNIVDEIKLVKEK